MTKPRRHHRVTTPCRIRKLGVLGALVAAAPAYLATPTPATAAPIDYVLNPKVMDNMTTDVISGTFTFDPLNFSSLTVDLK